jgi:IPT/TIG domain-containing protein
VTKLSLAAASTQGGTRTTVTGIGLGSLGISDATAVAVIGSDGTSRAGSVISRTSTTAVIELPAGPVGAARVALSSSLGTSADVLGDNVMYVDPLSASFVASTVPGTGGTKVPLIGTGFGATTAEFAALKLTATVNGLTSPLTWISSTQLLTSVPIGTPGKAATFVLLRSGVAGTPATATYTAAIGSAGWTTDAATGALTGKLSGAGFTSSTAWTLTGPAGTPLALPVVASPTALAAAPLGVLLVSGTSATVKLPANPGVSGAWALSFTPDQATYPGAAFGPTAAACVTFTAPAITKLSGAAASVHGGTSVTVTGSSLASLDPADAGAATLTNSAGDTLSATLVSRTATSAVVTLPAAAAGTWTLRLTSSLGTSSAVAAANISFVEPLSAAFDALTVPASGAARVTLSGSGFGANATEFAALLVTAKVGTAVLRPTWVSATQVAVALPSGKPGTSAVLVLYRNGVPGSATSVTYAAAIATASWAGGPTSVTGTLTGAGMLGSTSWTFTGPSGQTVAVPVVTTSAALAAATAAVLVTSDRGATVKVPAHPGAAGTWTLSFTPRARRSTRTRPTWPPPSPG